MTVARRIEDLSVSNRTGLVRVDYNVPLQNATITDASRIRASLPTIQALRAAGANLILISHLGRPQGGFAADLSFAPLVGQIAHVLGQEISFVRDVHAAATRSGGPVALLENIRFNAGEENNDAAFSDTLAALGDFYVNDALSISHRAHASVVGLAQRLPSAVGIGLETELKAIAKALAVTRPPIAAIVGGSKVSTKLRLLETLCERVDHLLLGGAIANTFLAAQGVDVGASLVEPQAHAMVKTIRDAAHAANCQVHLPIDALSATHPQAQPMTSTLAEPLAPEARIYDLGPKTITHYYQVLAQCQSVIFNAPLGLCEYPAFAQATCQIVRYIQQRVAQNQLYAIAGGGDTCAVLKHYQLNGAFNHVSLAGGAFLELLEGRVLPGLAALGVDFAISSP